MRARTKVLRISPFGLIEMTRQRIRPSLRRSVYEDCPCCNGVGQVKTSESLTIEAMRLVMAAASDDTVFLLVSDHGHSATPIHKLSSQHRHGPPGVLLAWGGPIRAGIAVEGAHVFDVMPNASA